MANGPARIISIGSALPPCIVDQKLAVELLIKHYRNTLSSRSVEALQKLFNHPGILTRHFALESRGQLINLKDEDPDVRIERFRKWAVRLSSEAVLSAIKNTGLSVGDITCLVVNTCTGYLCPGISTYLIEHLRMKSSIKAYDIVGAGCGGAVPNLQLGATLAEKGEIVVSVAVEICSATFEMGNEMSLIVSNAIFGDGAAAALIWNRPQGVEFVDSESFYDPEYREDVRYTHRNGRLFNQLSPGLPKILEKKVPPFTIDFLSKHHLSPENISHWALHPGGEKIISGLEERFCIPHEKLAFSRDIMKRCGNMSSPTVLFELEQIMKGDCRPGDFGIILAFGAGLSVYGALLRW